MTLVLFIPRDITQLGADTQCAWVLFDRSNIVLREGTTSLSEIPKAEKVILALPANRVLYTQTRLPNVSASKRESLLRYAIEDKLTTDPATIHAVLYLPPAPQSTVSAESVVAAVEREWLRNILDALQASGLNVLRAVDAAQTLPINAGAWSVCIEAGHGFAVRPDGYAYGFDLTTDDSAPFPPPFPLTLAISEARKSDAAPAMLNVYGDESRCEQWSASLGLPVHYQGAWNTQQMATTILAKSAATNLLTGEFVPKSDWTARLKLMKPALIVAALIVFVHVSFTAWDVWRLTKQRDALQAGMKQIFMESFPQAKTIVDAPLQLQRNLEALQAEHGANGQTPEKALLARASAILDSANSGVVIASLHYEKAVLTAQASAPSATALAALQARAESQQATLQVENENAFMLRLGAAR